MIVVGGGPGGAAAAFHLARAGVDVLILEREVFPRDKVCGDFLGPAALVDLADMGLPQRADYLRTNVIRRAALHLDGKLLVRRTLPKIAGLPDYGRVIPRARLDAWLAEAACRAGARLREGVQVTALASEAGGVLVQTRGAKASQCWRARLLIGADGSHSICAQFLRGCPPGWRERIFAVRAYLDDCRGPEDEASLFFSSRLFPGYYWLFPTGNGRANVGLGVLPGSFPRLTPELRRKLEAGLMQDPALRSRVESARTSAPPAGWPLNTYQPGARLAGRRVLLVGDAASLVNPLNGEGIQYALLSGKLAAQAARRSLETGSFTDADLESYAAQVRDRIGSDLLLAHLLIRTIANRSLNPLWLEALRLICTRARLDPGYGERVGGLLAGSLPFREALSRKVLLGTLEQAAARSAFRAAWSLVRGPSAWAGAAIGAAGLGFTAACDVARDPQGFLRWGAGAAEAALRSLAVLPRLRTGKRPA